jgi:hypothetical protein
MYFILYIDGSFGTVEVLRNPAAHASLRNSLPEDLVWMRTLDPGHTTKKKMKYPGDTGTQIEHGHPWDSGFQKNSGNNVEV